MAKAYLAGDLTERITVQQRGAAAQNALGEDTSAWENLLTVWARAEPLRGREYFAAGQMQVVTDVRFVVRWSPAAATITPAMRVLWRGVPHDIAAAIHVDAARQWVEIMAVQGARDGR